MTEIATGEGQTSRYWIDFVAERADASGPGLSADIGKGILTERDQRFLWVFRPRRYLTVHGDDCKEARRRVIEVLRSDEAPDPRDVSDLSGRRLRHLPALMSRRELRKLTPRIKRVARSNLIGLTTARAIVDIRVAVVHWMGVS